MKVICSVLIFSSVLIVHSAVYASPDVIQMLNQMVMRIEAVREHIKQCDGQMATNHECSQDALKCKRLMIETYDSYSSEDIAKKILAAAEAEKICTESGND